MDFFISRVPIPPAVVLYAKGEIGTAGQDVLRDAIIAELSGTCPIILDLRDVRYVAERQISGPIINAQINSYYSGNRARRVAVVGADSVMGKYLEKALDGFFIICETEAQALMKLGVRREPGRPKLGTYHYTRSASTGREIDREEYLEAFERWFLLLLEHEQYQRAVPDLRAWWSGVVREELPTRAKVDEFCRRMPGLPEGLHLTVLKSNLLFRMLYLGEPVRQRRCPGTKMKFGDREVTHHPYQECQCGGCGWLL